MMIILFQTQVYDNWSRKNWKDDPKKKKKSLWDTQLDIWRQCLINELPIRSADCRLTGFLSMEHKWNAFYLQTKSNISLHLTVRMRLYIRDS